MYEGTVNMMYTKIVINIKYVFSIDTNFFSVLGKIS